MEEIWKPVPGYEVRYEVSNIGRVKSLNYYGKGVEGILSQRLNMYGYFKVNVGKKQKSVHQLVAMAFLGHIPDGTQNLVVNHKDSIRTNNRVENLEIVTMRENIVHGAKKRISSSKYIGVSLNHIGWASSIFFNNKQYNLGYYKLESDAGNAYINASEAIKNCIFVEYYKEYFKRYNGDKNMFTSDDFTSVYRGVHLHPKTNRWVSSITRNNKTYRLGQFETELDAHLEFKNAEKAYNDDIFKEYLKGLNTNRYIKTSEYKGINLEKQTNKWSVHINNKNKSVYLSYYDSEEEAHSVYVEAEKNIINGTFDEFVISIKNRYKVKCEYENVYYNTKVNKWVGFTLVNGKEVKIGYYKTKESANKALSKILKSP